MYQWLPRPKASLASAKWKGSTGGIGPQAGKTKIDKAKIKVTRAAWQFIFSFVDIRLIIVIWLIIAIG
jgi:hypothetical protein